MRGLYLLTAKPVTYAANVAEGDLADMGAKNPHVKAAAGEGGGGGARRSDRLGPGSSFAMKSEGCATNSFNSCNQHQKTLRCPPC